MLRRPPTSTLTDTLLPDPTLFRSHARRCARAKDVSRRSRGDGGARGRPEPGDHRRRRGRRSQRCRGQTRPLGTNRGDRGVKLLTGNDLKTGAVTWWTGRDWSIHIEDAVDVGEEGDAIASAEEGARRVNGPVVIAAEATAAGPRPAHLHPTGNAPGR